MSPSTAALRAGLMVVVFLAPVAAQDGEAAAGGNWRVRLLAPLSTKFSRKGDIVSARVLEPAAFQGGILEGVVKELKAAANNGGTSSVRFDLETLHLPDKALAVSANLVEALNSRHEKGVDDEGGALKTGGRGLGGKLGGVFHGGGDSVVLNVSAPSLYFATGSELILQVQVRTVR